MDQIFGKIKQAVMSAIHNNWRIGCIWSQKALVICVCWFLGISPCCFILVKHPLVFAVRRVFVSLAERVDVVSNLCWSDFFPSFLLRHLRWSGKWVWWEVNQVQWGTHCSPAVRLSPYWKHSEEKHTHLDWETYQQSRKPNSLMLGYLTWQIAVCSCSYGMIAASGPY